MQRRRERQSPTQRPAAAMRQQPPDAREVKALLSEEPPDHALLRLAHGHRLGRVALLDGPLARAPAATHTKCHPNPTAPAHGALSGSCKMRGRPPVPHVGPHLARTSWCAGRCAHDLAPMANGSDSLTLMIHSRAAFCSGPMAPASPLNCAAQHPGAHRLGGRTHRPRAAPHGPHAHAVCGRIGRKRTLMSFPSLAHQTLVLYLKAAATRARKAGLVCWSLPPPAAQMRLTRLISDPLLNAGCSSVAPCHCNDDNGGGRCGRASTHALEGRPEALGVQVVRRARARGPLGVEAPAGVSPRGGRE